MEVRKFAFSVWKTLRPEKEPEEREGMVVFVPAMDRAPNCEDLLPRGERRLSGEKPET